MAAQSISTADLLIIFLVTSCATFVTLAIWDMFFRRQEVIYVPVQAVPKQKRPTSRSRSRPRSKSKDRRPSICPTGLHTNGIYCPCRIKNKLGLNTHSPKLSKKAVNLNGNNSNNHQARGVPFFAKALERHHGQHRMVEAIIEKVLVIESMKMKNLLSPALLRCRDVHAYAYIISHLRGQVPSLLGKETMKKKLIAALGDVFAQLPSQYQISPDDFPNIKHNQEQHQFHDFSKFQPLKLKLLKSVDRMLARYNFQRSHQHLAHTVNFY